MDVVGNNMTFSESNLYLGDCRDYLGTLPSMCVDLIVTDPPYGIQYKSGRQTVDRQRSLKGEGSIVCREQYFSSIAEDQRLLTDWIKEGHRVLKDNGAIYVFAHWSKWCHLHLAMSEVGFSVKNMIVLNKSNHGMGDLTGSYAPKHELLLFAVKGKHKLTFPEGRINDVWNVPVKFSGAKRFHPNEKPIEWFIPAVENSSNEGDVVLDPFMGSGTTGIVATSMGRKFVGAEKDREYFKIAEERITDAVRQRSNNLL